MALRTSFAFIEAAPPDDQFTTTPDESNVTAFKTNFTFDVPIFDK